MGAAIGNCAGTIQVDLKELRRENYRNLERGETVMVGNYSASGGLAPWNHVGVYVGDNKIVEFTPVHYVSSYQSGGVRRVSLDSFVSGHRHMYRVKYVDWTYGANTIFTRAIAVLGDPEGHGFSHYSQCFNNSKHFASYVSVKQKGHFYVRNLQIG